MPMPERDSRISLVRGVLRDALSGKGGHDQARRLNTEPLSGTRQLFVGYRERKKHAPRCTLRFCHVTGSYLNPAFFTYYISARTTAASASDRCSDASRGETDRPNARFPAVEPGGHAAPEQSGATPYPAATAVRSSQSELPSFSDGIAVHGAVRSYRGGLSAGHRSHGVAWLEDHAHLSRPTCGKRDGLGRQHRANLSGDDRGLSAPQRKTHLLRS